LSVDTVYIFHPVNFVHCHCFLKESIVCLVLFL
jgi:hypothetical protein